jgi:hypothetical protein
VVRQTYAGLGGQDAAVRAFDGLLPHVLQIRALQAKCGPLGPDEMALQIAVDGLETAAYHFTRRRLYYDHTRIPRDHGRDHYEGLGEPAEAVAAFEALAPFARALAELQRRCRPFGRDYLALDIAKQSLDSAAYHFTRTETFYGSRSDSTGRVRPKP